MTFGTDIASAQQFSTASLRTQLGNNGSMQRRERRPHALPLPLPAVVAERLPGNRIPRNYPAGNPWRRSGP